MFVYLGEKNKAAISLAIDRGVAIQEIAQDMGRAPSEIDGPALSEVGTAAVQLFDIPKPPDFKIGEVR
jgi:hypothetical protein